MQTNLFGLSAEEEKKANDNADRLPTFSLKTLEVGKKARIKVLDKVPKLITFTVDERGNQVEKTAPVLTIFDKASELKMNLWCSSKTLAMSLQGISTKNNGTLENLDLVIVAEDLEHPTLGPYKGYRAMLDESAFVAQSL